MIKKYFSYMIKHQRNIKKKYSENLKMFDFIKKISHNKRNSHQLVIQYIPCKFGG